MSMINETSRRRGTSGQLENLWEFLNKHKDLATGYNKSSHAREFSRRMWKEIALALNSHGSGAVKDWKGWCKYWNNYKGKLKKLAAAYASAQHVTGGGQSTSKAPTDIERKFLHILGNDFGSWLPGIRVEPFVVSHVPVESDLVQRLLDRCQALVFNQTNLPMARSK